MALTQEQKDTLNRYSVIKSEIKRLEAQADELNRDVLQLMEDNELGEVELSIGKLSLGSRRTWKYTDKVSEMDKEIKKLKEYEEQTGSASYVEKKYVVFKGK